jgi:ATP-dependent Lhr-like helicase
VLFRSFTVQARLSRIPAAGAVLAEWTLTGEGSHLFLFPFEGRRVHEGLAALIALRVGRQVPATFTLAVNDYGMEILTPDPLPWPRLLGPALFGEEGLLDDILTSVNLTELMRRRFREIARVAGLVFPGLPGRPRAAKQVQSSASLLYDVFCRYDPENLLLVQARREVLEQHFEESRLREALTRLRETPVELVRTPRLTPLATPLANERLAVDRQSHESVRARVDRLARRRPRR